METYWKAFQKIRKGTSFCRKSRKGKWFEEISKRERMWGRQLQAYGGLETRSGMLNWTYMLEELIEDKGVGCSISNYTCEEMDRAIVHKH